MENKEFEYAMKQMRLERHEFMNYLQVISGYIQINRAQSALDYIKKINYKMQNLSKINNLNCPYFALLMQDFIYQCSKVNVEVEFDSELEYISSELFSKNIDKEKKIFFSIKDVVIKALSKSSELNNKLYVFIKGDPVCVCVTFSNIEDYTEKQDVKFSIHEYESLINKNSEDYILDLYTKNGCITIVFKDESNINY